MKTVTVLAALAIAATPAAYAQQRGHAMSGTDMQAMMNQCAKMRRQMAQGTMANTPQMTRTMAQCDQMDRQMGASGAQMPMPSATRSR